MIIQKRFKYLPGTPTYSLQQTCIENSLRNRNPRELMAQCDRGMPIVGEDWGHFPGNSDTVGAKSAVRITWLSPLH